MTALCALVLALAMVETPNGIPVRPGPYGETGRWQLRPGTRADREHDLRRRGILHPTDETLATEQVLWLQRSLRFIAIEPNAFNVALAWNAGLWQATRGRAPVSAYGFAGRVTALAEQNEKSTEQATAGPRGKQ